MVELKTKLWRNIGSDHKTVDGFFNNIPLRKTFSTYAFTKTNIEIDYK